MFKRTSYLVIILLLLTQLISCLPRSSSSDSVDSILPETTTITPSVGENAVPSGHNSFQEALLKGLVNIVNVGLQKSNQIAKDVLADPSMNSIHSEAMQKELNLLRQYVADSKEALNKVLPAEQFLTRKVLPRFKRFYYFETDPLTPEQQVIKEALKKHGFLEYDEELDKLQSQYPLYLVDEFEKYVKTLSVAEKEKDQDMKDMMAAWNAYTKNETSTITFAEKLLNINLKL